MGIQVASSPRLQFQKYALNLDNTSARAVGAAANAMKKEILRVAPARLRGVGKRGRKLSVRYDVKGDTALVKAVGPWQLIENDSKPHLIVSKKAGTRRARAQLAAGLFVTAPGRRGGGRGAILTPQGPRAYARHPGTRGQHPWARGIERGTPAATLAYIKVIEADLKRQFG